MTISLSAHRCMRKCQRQFYYRYLLASHNARDPIRHEAFILKQLTGTEAWAGNLVHQCLEDVVATSLTAGRSIDWTSATEGTITPMRRQFAFSQARRYEKIAIEAALRDIFWLSLLCWPVPNRYIRLPIDVKLCDDELSVVAAQLDDDDEQSDEENENDNDPLLASNTNQSASGG